MLKKITLSLSVGFVALAAVALANPAMSKEVTLTAASCFPIGNPSGVPFENVVKAINKEGKGIVQIDLKGGAPAIGSPFTLTQKMQMGVYDFVGCTEAYFGNIFPWDPALRFSDYPYSELRKNGAIALVNKLMEKKGIHYIGRYADLGPFHLWLSKKIDKPDLTGLNLRVVPIYTAFFRALGATVQTSNVSQVYTYMANGTVQGYGWPALGWVPAWIKVTKYRVDPGFYHATLHMLANLRTWKSLTQQQRNLITGVVLKFEANAETTSPAFQARMQAQYKKTAAEGLRTITFTGAARKKWLTTARKAGWDEVLRRNPKIGPELMKLFTK